MSNEKFSLEDDILGSDFGADADFGASPNSTPKTKSQIVTEFASGLWDGVKSQVMSRGEIEKNIRSLLPRSYTPVFDAKDRTARFTEDLYDKLRENTATGVKEIRSLTKDVMVLYGSRIPESVAAQLSSWANGADDDDTPAPVRASETSQLDIDADVPPQISDGLETTIRQSADLSGQLAQAQHQELVSTMSAIATSQNKINTNMLLQLQGVNRTLNRQLGYTENITNTYQRRQLELQYRQYRLQISVAKMQEGFYKKSLKAFEGLIKNTSLSDYEKSTTNASSVRGALAKQLGFAGPVKALSRYGNHLFDTLLANADSRSQRANAGMMGLAPMFRTMLSATAAARNSGARMDARGYGAMVGSGMASMLPLLLQRYVRPHMTSARGGRISKMGSDLSFMAESAPGLINSWLRGRNSFDESYNEFDPKNKWYTKFQKGMLNPALNNLLFQLPVQQGNRTKLNTLGIKDLNQPAQYNLLTQRSIVEIIPGLLTQQLTELKKISSGDQNAEAPVFNHREGTFTSKKQNQADMRAAVFNRVEFGSSAAGFNDIVNIIDPDNQLSGNARIALAMRLARDTDAGDSFNINNYTRSTGWVNTDKGTVREIVDFMHKRFKTRKATGAARAMGELDIGDSAELSATRRQIGASMRSQANYMPDVEQTLNNLANSGHRSTLKEMGIIKRVNGVEVFNHDAYWEMMREHMSSGGIKPGVNDQGLSKDEQDLLKERFLDQNPKKNWRDRAADKFTRQDNNSGVDDIKRSAVNTTDVLQARTNELLEEAVEVMASVRDVGAATAAATEAAATGDNGVITKSRTERSGWLSRLKSKMDNTGQSVRRYLPTIVAGSGKTAGLTASLMSLPAVKLVQRLAGRIQDRGAKRDTKSSDVDDADPASDPAKRKSSDGFINKLLGDRAEKAADRGEPIKEEKNLSGMERMLLGIYRKLDRRQGSQVSNDPDGDGIRNNSWRDIFRRRKEQKEAAENEKKLAAGKDPSKAKPKTMFGLLSGLFSGVLGFVGDIKRMGIIGGLANFLGMGWLADVGGLIAKPIEWLGKLLMAKKGGDLITDLADDAGDLLDGDGKGKGRGGRGARGAARGGKRGLFRRLFRLGGKGARGTGRAALSAGEGMLSRTKSLFSAGRSAVGGALKGVRDGAGSIIKNTKPLQRLAGGVARRIIDEPGKMMGRASWLLKGGMGTVAKIAGGAAVAGMSAWEGYNAYKEGDMHGVAEAAGGGVGGMLGGAAMGAAIGSVVPVVGTFVGGVIGGALGSLGGSAIAGKLFDMFNNPGLLQQMRLRQYGIPDNTSDHVGPVMKLEAACEKFVKITDSGMASLDAKLPLNELVKLFISDTTDQDKMRQWATWFIMRFKPVYLTHMALAKNLFPSTKFSELDKSKDSKAKYELARRAQQFDDTSDHPYRYDGIIFDDLQASDMTITTKLVADVVQQLKEQSDKATNKGQITTSLLTTGSDSAVRNTRVKEDVLKAINPGKEDIRGLSPKGEKWYGDREPVSVDNLLGNLLPKSGEPLDDLTAGRMKVYGMQALDIERVSAILQLELVMMNNITFSDQGCRFSGRTSDIWQTIGSTFGYNQLSQGGFKNWSTWFSRRFLPTYLTFASTIYLQTGDKRPTLSAKTLPPETRLAAMIAMNQATYNYNRTSKSVWSVQESAWYREESNTDASVVTPQINNLKQQVRVAQYQAPEVKGIKQAPDGTTDKEWRKDKSTGGDTSSGIRTSNGTVYSSQRQESVYNPATGNTTIAYGGNQQFGAPNPAGGAAIDNTGKYEPPRPGPGTEEGIRIMLKKAKEMGITDKTELAMLLAQTAEESGGFSLTEENLRYRPETMMRVWPNRFPTMASAAAVAKGGPVAIANSIYGNRMGNKQPGDGYKFRGRGFIQLTGKDNYEKASKGLGVDLTQDPDKVSDDPEMSAKTAIWYWNSRSGLRSAAQRGDVAAATKLINGGLTNLGKRQGWFKFFQDKISSGAYDDVLSGDGNKDGDDQPATGLGAEMAQASQQEGLNSPALAGTQTAAEKTAAGGAIAGDASAPPTGGGSSAPGSSAPAGGNGGAPASTSDKTGSPSTGAATPASMVAPPGATPPPVKSTTGPSANATKNAQSVTPTARDSTASADDTLNKVDMQRSAPPIAPGRDKPIPVTMDTNDKAERDNGEILKQILKVLESMSGSIGDAVKSSTGNGGGGNQSNPNPGDDDTGDMTRQSKMPADWNTKGTPVLDSGNKNISSKRMY